MNKKTSEFIGIILILLGLRGAVGTFKLAVNFGSNAQFASLIVTGIISALSMFTCGIMLTVRCSLKSVCTVLGGALAAKGACYIIAACISIPQLNALMDTPDSQLPGLNVLSATLGLFSVRLMFIEAALCIAGAAFGTVFMRKGKLFIPAVIFLILMIVFLLVVDGGRGNLPWLLFLATVIYTQRISRLNNEKNETAETTAAGMLTSGYGVISKSKTAFFMNKAIPPFIGAILLLWGFAAAVLKADSLKNTDWWDVSLLIRDALTILAYVICGTVLILRRSMRSAAFTLGGLIAAIGAYCIIAVIISVPIIFENAPDDNSCGMGFMMGLGSVMMMAVSGVFSTAGAAFGSVFIRKRKLFSLAVITAVLMIVFQFNSYDISGVVLRALFLAAVICTKIFSANIEAAVTAVGE
ncbi:MAG: hypothetical protein K2N72_02735 [Oscillospiraceae bacterium]|nr:hypothetical protein [Oscillospiraceae bacterium]